jgi:hypothetical protein
MEGSAATAEPAGVSAVNAPEQPQEAAIDSGPKVETVAPAATAQATAAAATTDAPPKAEAAALVDARAENDAPAPVSQVESPTPASAAVAPGVATADGVQGQRQGVGSVARERVDEGLRPRAEKLRRASNVVLDEAAADPSLRFVLVATALIILSLLLLLLGRIL